MPDAWLGIGSNLGDKTGNLRAAPAALARHGTIAAVSPLYATEPVGPVEQDWFLNACAHLETGLDAAALLAVIERIESDLGRERGIPNGPRTIDIDLLLYDDLIVESAELTVPHPRMHLRRFVLEPLAAIAPGLLHPRLGKTIADLLREQPASPAVRLVRGAGWQG